MDIDNIPQLLNARRTAITFEEDSRLDKQLGVDHRDLKVDELEFAIATLSEWFRHRRLLTDPPDLCLRTVRHCRPLLYGPLLFAEAGGNLKSVDMGLELSRLYSPERDLPAISLFCNAGRINVGEYTYRNTLWVPSGQRSSLPYQRVAVDALRPVSLIPTTVIQELESLVNRDNLRELDIQEFLDKHPEILLSLGYAQAYPHLALREPGKPDMIPDYFLEIPGQRRSDILDLKLPTVRLTVRNPYLNLSAQLNKAIGQLRACEQYFEKSKNRRAFTNAYGLDAFKPGLIVVIGRRAELSQLESRVEIEARLAGVRLLTYDDLIDYGRSRSLLVPSVRP